MSRAILRFYALVTILVLTPITPFPLTAKGIHRVYHPVTIQEMPTTSHTHVCVSGIVTLIKHEGDGDLHVRLSADDSPAADFIIAEEIPALRAPGPRPKLGTRMTACGISRRDRTHGWDEVHPVERWE